MMSIIIIASAVKSLLWHQHQAKEASTDLTGAASLSEARAVTESLPAQRSAWLPRAQSY